MGSDVKKIPGFIARGGEVPYVDPNEIKIVGLDIPMSDELWHAYCPRAEEEPEADFVASIRADGVRQPVDVFRNGEQLVLLEGRRRVKAARVVWAEQAKKGVPRGERAMVRVNIHRGKPEELFKYNVGSHERKELAPTQRALLMNLFFQNCGEDWEKTAKVFQTSTTTVRNQIQLLDCSKAVQDAVDKRQVSVASALQLTKLTRDEQNTKLAEFRKANGVAPNDSRTRAPKRALVVGVKPITRGKLIKTYEAVKVYVGQDEGNKKDQILLAIEATLAWAAGRPVNFPLVERLLTETKGRKNKATKGAKGKGKGKVVEDADDQDEADSED